MVEMDEKTWTEAQFQQALWEFEYTGRADQLGKIAWYYDDVLLDSTTACRYYALDVDVKGPGWKVSTYNLAHILHFYKDPDRAMELLKTIEDEDLDAVRLLAEMYARRDLDVSMRYYQRLVDEKHGKGIYSLAMTHWFGRGKIQRDHALAFKYMKMAAELGTKNAWIKVAHFHQLGIGVPKSIKGEVEALRKVPDDEMKGIPKFNLAFYHFEPHDAIGIPQDLTKAVDTFHELVNDEALPDAMYQLGRSWEFTRRNPDGVSDLKRARQWYERAAKHGSLLAMNRLCRVGLKYTPAGTEQELGLSAEEKAPYLKQLLEKRWRLSPVIFTEDITSPTVTLDWDVLQVIYREMQALQKDHDEMYWKPPPVPEECGGGPGYQELLESFYEHAAENDLRKRI